MSSISVRFNSFLFLYSIFNEHIVNPLVNWSVWMDSNHRHHAYQACALTTWATDRFFWWFPVRFHYGSDDFPSAGGDDGVRTHDPLLAGQVLSQLSYTPILTGSFLFKDLQVSCFDPWKLNNKRLGTNFCVPVSSWLVWQIRENLSRSP